MRRAAFLLAFCAHTLWGQLIVDGGSSWKGLRIRFATRIEPGRPLPEFDGSVIDAGISGTAAQRFSMNHAISTTSSPMTMTQTAVNAIR